MLDGSCFLEKYVKTADEHAIRNIVCSLLIIGFVIHSRYHTVIALGFRFLMISFHSGI